MNNREKMKSKRKDWFSLYSLGEERYKKQNLSILIKDIKEKCPDCNIIVFNHSAFSNEFSEGLETITDITIADTWKEPGYVPYVILKMLNQVDEDQSTFIFFPKLTEYFVIDYIIKHREHCRNIHPITIIGNMGNDKTDFFKKNLKVATLMRKLDPPICNYWLYIFLIPIDKMVLTQLSKHGYDFSNWSKSNRIPHSYRVVDEDALKMLKKSLNVFWLECLFDFYGVEGEPPVV